MPCSRSATRSNATRVRVTFKFPTERYEIVYADPPWSYYGSQTKMGAAGSHYELMTDDEVYNLPVRSIMKGHSALFIWATCPKLDRALKAIEQWELSYRGVAYVWVKTRRDGVPMGARGVTPTFVKPVVELVLVATPQKTGRPFTVRDLKHRQTVFAPVGKHSAKPPEVRERIVQLLGDRSRIELFARGVIPGWDTWGLEAGLEPDTMCEHKEED